jgi:hypothetical protein
MLLGVEPKQYLADVGAAAGASFCVAPFIAAVDQAIVQNASGQAPLLVSLRASLRSLCGAPHVFLRQPAFLMLWGVYGGTYVAVNWVTSVCDAQRASALERNQAKFSIVSGVNLTLNISKDRAFAQMFGGVAPPTVPVVPAPRSVVPLSERASGAHLGRYSSKTSAPATAPRPVLVPVSERASGAHLSLYTSKKPTPVGLKPTPVGLKPTPAPMPAPAVPVPRPVPLRSIAAFGLRDCMTVFASFNLAPLVGEALGAPAAAQLVCPVAMQWLSAPIHLWGLDSYNRPAVVDGAPTRTAFIRAEYVKTALARCARILPAFGVCPLINKPMRESAHAAVGVQDLNVHP